MKSELNPLCSVTVSTCPAAFWASPSAAHEAPDWVLYSTAMQGHGKKTTSKTGQKLEYCGLHTIPVIALHAVLPLL